MCKITNGVSVNQDNDFFDYKRLTRRCACIGGKSKN